MTTITSYKDLRVWMMSMKLVKEIYELTSTFPKDERFGITDQMRRSAISIPSNIAEGYCRWGRTEYARFCRIAFGSAAELETQILISKELKLGNLELVEDIESQINQVQRSLNKLIQSLTK